MLQKHETQAVGAVLGSEMHFAAGSSDASEDDTCKLFGQGLDDPLRILRTHWGDDVPSPFQQNGVAAEIVSDFTFRRKVAALCHRPRLVAELLAEIAAERNLRSEVEDKLERFCGLTDEDLSATGGDRFPPAPLHVVAP